MKKTLVVVVLLVRSCFPDAASADWEDHDCTMLWNRIAVGLLPGADDNARKIAIESAREYVKYCKHNGCQHKAPKILS